MKKIILLVTFILLATFLTIAQEPADIPAAPATPVLRDDNIRMRSVDLERAKQDAAKNNVEATTVTDDIEKKYPEIKEDFESMQLSQAAIIEAYTMSQKIDYAIIEASAGKINKNAKRLDSNLFLSKTKEKTKDKDKDEKETKSIRNLIIDLDNAIGDVTTSPMFQNLRVIDSEVAKKTQADLAKIMSLSDELSEAAKKMK